MLFYYFMLCFQNNICEMLRRMSRASKFKCYTMLSLSAWPGLSHVVRARGKVANRHRRQNRRCSRLLCVCIIMKVKIIYGRMNNNFDLLPT